MKVEDVVHVHCTRLHSCTSIKTSINLHNYWGENIKSRIKHSSCNFTVHTDPNQHYCYCIESNLAKDLNVQ